MGDVQILDGLLTIRDEPFTDVFLHGSSFRRWSPDEITRYHAGVRSWRRWRWLPVPVRRMFGLPMARPADRRREISGCLFVGGGAALGAAGADPEARGQ